MKNYNEKFHIATFSNNAVSTAEKYGFGLEINNFCISNNLNPENIEKTIESVIDDISKSGCGDRIIMHGPFTELTPDAIDSRAINLMRERYIQTFEVCKRLKIAKIVLHSGYIPLMYQKNWHKERSIEFWRILSEEIPEGMTVFIENVFEDEPFLLRDVVSETNRKNIRACLDIGHANAMTDKRYDIFDWIDTLAEVTGHFHIHNNNGRADLHDDIDKGTMDMGKILKYIDGKLPAETTLTIESTGSEASAAFIRELYSK